MDRTKNRITWIFGAQGVGKTHVARSIKHYTAINLVDDFDEHKETMDVFISLLKDGDIVITSSREPSSYIRAKYKGQITLIKISSL